MDLTTPHSSQGGAGKSMELVTPYNSKGGIGKSMLALALAAGIKIKDPRNRVLFIDATQDQGSHSVNFAPTNERKAIGLGSAVGEILMNQGNDFEEGLEKARDIFNKALVPVCVAPPTEDENYLIDFLPCAGSKMVYHGAGPWRQMPNPAEIIAYLFQAVDADNRWDWCVVDLPAAEGGIASRSFIPLASAVVLPMDVRHKATFNGIERTMKGLREIPNLNIAGFIANFHDDTAACRRAMTHLKKYAEQEQLPVLAQIPDRTTFTNIFDTYDIILRTPDGKEGDTVIGGGLYHLLKHDYQRVRDTVEKALPDFERMVDVVMESATAATAKAKAAAEAVGA